MRWLVLVLNLVGWEASACFLDRSQSEATELELIITYVNKFYGQKNLSHYAVIGFSFESDWLRGWCLFPGPITERSKAKHRTINQNSLYNNLLLTLVFFHPATFLWRELTAEQGIHFAFLCLAYCWKSRTEKERGNNYQLQAKRNPEEIIKAYTLAEGTNYV